MLKRLILQGIGLQNAHCPCTDICIEQVVHLTANPVSRHASESCFTWNIFEKALQSTTLLPNSAL